MPCIHLTKVPISKHNVQAAFRQILAVANITNPTYIPIINQHLPFRRLRLLQLARLSHDQSRLMLLRHLKRPFTSFSA
jgi:hypothetical protein